MKKYINKRAIIFPLFVLLVFTVYFNIERVGFSQGGEGEPVFFSPPVKSDRIEKIEITDGATYGVLMEGSGVSPAVAAEIYEAAEPIYDLAKIRSGRFLELVYNKDTDELKELVYKINAEEELYIKKSAKAVDELGGDIDWQAEIKPIDYIIKIKTAGGEIKTSMYEAALDNDIDIRAIIELANAFQWSVDFAMDPRVGDTFKFVYEERFLDGEYVMPGKILAGRYVNAGEAYEVYYFKETEDNQGYFDRDGNSVQKIFLKAPVAFKYISSGFTTGRRYVKKFNVATGHKAIDYAAQAGTPIRSVGDGLVSFAGWSSQGYGYLTSIRHNATYSTNYAHQSKIIVKKGQKVKQGDVIGYVGSTGFSTGPHLHYEMVKYGAKVNPFNEVLPPGKPIKEENKERFFKEIKSYIELLNNKTN